jgi:hypothetical protein
VVAYSRSGGEAGYGIIWGTDDVNRYAFLVTAEGTCLVDWVEDKKAQEAPVPLATTVAIKQGSLANHLRVVVSGARAALEVNGVSLGTIALAMGGPYKVGVFGWSGSTVPSEVRFTEFSVSVPSAAEVAVPLAAPAARATHRLPFTDTFADTKSGWDRLTSPAAGRDYRDGEYALWFDQPGFILRSWAPLASCCPDTLVVETKAYGRSGGGNADYGIGWGLDDASYYLFLVRADGTYAVLGKENERLKDGPIPWTESSSILQGGSANSLRLTIWGNKAAIEVNGENLGTIILAMRGPYKVGICGWSGNHAPWEVRFTEFSVSVPSAAEAAVTLAAPPARTTHRLPFTDTFDDVESGWVRQSSPTASWDYRDGEYALWLAEPQQRATCRAPLSDRCPQSFAVEITAYTRFGGEDTAYGIWWGFDSGNYYSANVRADGFYSVGWVKDNQIQEPPVPWTTTGFLSQGASTNHLRVVVGWDRAAIVVNGTNLGTILLVMKGPYKVGVCALSGKTVPVEVRFAEFSVSGRSPSQELAAPAIKTGSSLPFIDTFSNTMGGWGNESSESSGREYRDGEYALWLAEPQQMKVCWAPLSDRCPETFAVETTAYRRFGGDDAAYGIRWGLDNDNFYVLLVRVDGSYAIRWLKDDQWQTDFVPWTRSTAVNQGTPANRLRIVVSGDRAAVEVNRVHLGIITLPMKGPYRVGIVGESGDASPIEVRSTEFMVSVPPTGQVASPLASSPSETGLALRFADKFDDTKSGWPGISHDARGSGYQDGEYALWVTKPQWSTRVFAPLVAPCPETFAVEAAAYGRSGGDNVSYGIMWGLGETDFYLFVARADGSYAIRWCRNGQWQDDPVPWTRSSSVARGDSINKLGVKVSGDRVAIEVNGANLGTVTLAMKGPYRVGFCAASGYTVPIEVRVAEFSVLVP